MNHLKRSLFKDNHKIFKQFLSNQSLLVLLNLSLKNGLGAFIALISIPIIARIFQPEEIGIYSLVFTVASILSIPVGRKMELIIARVKSERDAEIIYTFNIIFAFSILISIFMFLKFYFFSAKIELANYRSISIVEQNIILVLLLTLILIIYANLTQLNLRKRDFKKVSRRSWTQNLFISVGQITLGLKYAEAQTLILFETLGRLGSLLLSGASNWKILKINKYSLKRYCSFSKKYLKFSIITVSNNLIETLTISLPFIFIVSFFDLYSAGQYTMASKFLAVPGFLVGVPLVQLITSKISKSKSLGENIRNWLDNNLIILILSAVIAILILAIFGLFGFRHIFGDSWSTAGIIFSILTLSSVSSILWLPISQFEILRLRHTLVARLGAIRLLTLLMILFCTITLSITLIHFIIILSVFNFSFDIISTIVCLRKN